MRSSWFKATFRICARCSATGCWSPNTGVICCGSRLASSTWTGSNRSWPLVGRRSPGVIRERRPRVCGRRLRYGAGHLFADFGYESFAQSEIARLEESRLAALEARVEADLALGEHAGLVGELEALVREHPLREHLVGQLMLALYRSGRQADALEAYRVARRGLVEELGIEPGGELQRLNQAILTQEPALELKPPAPEEPGARRAVTRRRRRGGVVILAGAALLLVALVAVAIQLAGSEPSSVRVAPNSLAGIDVKTDRVTSAMRWAPAPGRSRSGQARCGWPTSTTRRSRGLIFDSL